MFIAPTMNTPTQNKNFDELEIKSPRCKTINYYHMSVKNAVQEVRETQTKESFTDENQSIS